MEDSLANRSTSDETGPETKRRRPWFLIAVTVQMLVLVVMILVMQERRRSSAPETTGIANNDLRSSVDVFEEEIPEEEIPESVMPVEDDLQTESLSSPGESPENEEAWTEEDSICEVPPREDSNFGIISVGGGAPGSYGGRRGGRKHSRRRDGRVAQNSVDAGLAWLAQHQSPDGSWDADGFMARGDLEKGPLCDGRGRAQHDVGITGLALLCFLAAGETDKAGDYKHCVRAGLGWLRAQQDADGCFGSKASAQYTYDHAIAALAMVEIYGLTQSPYHKDAAVRGIAYVLRCQNPRKAWRYQEADGQNDTSVTGWMVMALKSAKASGLTIAPSRFAGALSWIEEVTDPATGRAGYRRRGEGPVRELGQAEAFPPASSESLTAIAVLARVFCGEDPRESDASKRGVALLLKSLPEWNVEAGSVDMYSWYFGTLAMYQVGGESWKTWNEAMKTAIIEHQRQEGNFAGSWDPVGPWGDVGGRVYATAMMTLCLEVYYRYSLVFSDH